MVLDEVGKYERKKAKEANKTSSSPYVSPSQGFETEWEFGREE